MWYVSVPYRTVPYHPPRRHTALPVGTRQPLSRVQSLHLSSFDWQPLLLLLHLSLAFIFVFFCVSSWLVLVLLRVFHSFLKTPLSSLPFLPTGHPVLSPITSLARPHSSRSQQHVPAQSLWTDPSGCKLCFSFFLFFARSRSHDYHALWWFFFFFF